MGKLIELAERCGQANGEDAYLDLDIYKALNPDGIGDIATLTDAPNYCASIDAAMTLVPEGWQVETLGQQSDGRWWTTLLRPLVADEQAGTVIRRSANERAFDCAAASLAICAAALRARSQSTPDILRSEK